MGDAEGGEGGIEGPVDDGWWGRRCGGEGRFEGEVGTRLRDCDEVVRVNRGFTENLEDSTLAGYLSGNRKEK